MIRFSVATHPGGNHAECRLSFLPEPSEDLLHQLRDVFWACRGKGFNESSKVKQILKDFDQDIVWMLVRSLEAGGRILDTYIHSGHQPADMLKGLVIVFE